jgi:hypothetical protein
MAKGQPAVGLEAGAEALWPRIGREGRGAERAEARRLRGSLACGGLACRGGLAAGDRLQPMQQLGPELGFALLAQGGPLTTWPRRPGGIETWKGGFAGRATRLDLTQRHFSGRPIGR